MDPQKDFTSWSQLLINSLTTQSNYTLYIPDCTELLFSILEIGELPASIKYFTKTFLDLIIPKSVDLLLQIPQETETDLEINMEFLSAVFSVCAWGVQSKKSKLYQLIPRIADSNNIFYLFHPASLENDLWKSVIDLFFESGNASIVFSLLDDANLQSLCGIFCILEIIYRCSPYKNNFLEEPKNKIIQLFNNFFIILKDPNEFKSVNEKDFLATYKLFISLASAKKWNLDLSSFFEFVYSAFKSEILERQISVSAIFCTFLLKLNIYSNHLTQLKHWCEQSNFIQFLVGKDFNENELPYLSSIFKYFSEHKLLPPNIIELLWQRVLQVHISQKEKYIMITVDMMKFVPINDLRLFFDKVTMKDHLYSDEVLKLLSHSLISLNYMISSQIASLLFKKAQINEKVKKVLFDSINDRMPPSTLNYISNLCFGLIESQKAPQKENENENEPSNSLTATESESLIKTGSNSLTKTDSNSLTKTESNSLTKTDSNSLTKTESNSLTKTDSNSLTKTESNSLTAGSNSLTTTESESLTHSESLYRSDQVDSIIEKSPSEIDNLLLSEKLLRKIISNFSKSNLPYMNDFEKQLISFLPYNRSVFFDLIAQYNIKMNKSVTSELFHIFTTELDDPLWNFMCKIFRSLGKNSLTDQVFNAIPSVIDKYDFQQATISFSSFLKFYLLLLNQKERKIVTNKRTSDHLPIQFHFTNPPIIGTDILFNLLKEVKEQQVASFVTETLLIFLTNFSNESEIKSFEIIQNTLLPVIISERSSNELKRRYLNLLFSILKISEKNIYLEDFGFERHNVYRSQKVIVTVQDKKIEKKFLYEKTDNLNLLKKRLSKLIKEPMIFLEYKGNVTESDACVNFYEIINNEITFKILYNNSPYIVPDLSNFPSVFLTNEDFQSYLFKLLNIEETSKIANELLDYLPNELSVISIVLDPLKMIKILNDKEIDFNYVKYCIQALLDQLIFGDIKTIKKTFSENQFLSKLLLFCKEFKEKSDKIIYEILRISYFLFTTSDENCTNELISLLFNVIINFNNDEITIRSAAFLYNKIISLFPNTDAVINNLDLFDKVISKSNKDIWSTIRDTTKTLQKVNQIFELINTKIEQINMINYQNYVDLFTLLIKLVPSDIVTNNVFDKCISVLLHEKGQTLISLCEVAISIIDSNNQLNSINPNIITQLLSRALQCDSSLEQKASFDLSISLIDKFPSCLDNIQKILSEFFKNPPNFWNYSPYQLEKKINGYAGLTNLGATCYMNSVFQQLFNCIQFRDLLFKEIEFNDSNDNGKKQIFDIFVNMLFGKKGFIETNEFCKVFKGWGKQLINTREQQDAVEFMNLFLDQLPDNLKQPFKGTFIHKIIDFNDSICSSNEENFFALSLDIKRFSTIEESFNSFLKYELFTGENQIFSDELGKKIDAKKYTRIKIAPPNLVLHLKRFEYSRSTFNYIKINSRFEVPQTIDISPLLQDDTSEKVVDNNSSNKYVLKGCVLHEGYANAGHYISLVKNNENQWIKCNDKQISPFNLNDFESETFGGFESNHFCAYLLFYQREDENKQISIQEEFNLLDSNLKEKIEIENNKFLEQQSIFSKNMIYLASHLQSTEIMTNYFINIFTHSSNGDDSYIITERLKENIRKNQSEKWLINHLISHFDSLIKPIYLNCNQQNILSSLNEIIESTFSSLNENDIFPLVNNFVVSFVDCISWRSFNNLLIIPLRYIKYYHIKTNENWRLSISKKIEDFYQQLISEVVLEEVNFSSAFSILQRITPIGIESNLIRPSLNTKILHSQTNYSHYFNFIVVTKQKYQINDIFKFYSNLNNNKFNPTKYIRLIINVLSYSDYDASSKIFNSNHSIQSIHVSTMFLYNLRINKPNLKESIIKHFKNCVCPLLFNFSDELSRIAISVVLELFDTVTPSKSLLSFKEKKPSSQFKWIPKIEKETNLNPPKEMFYALNQSIDFLNTELKPNPKKYYIYLSYFSILLRWFLSITNDYKIEYFTSLLDFLKSYKMNLDNSNIQYCYEYIVSILCQFPIETTQKVDFQYLPIIYLKIKDSTFVDSKNTLFLKCAINSPDKVFISYFQQKEEYEFIKKMFLTHNCEEANICIKRLIEFFPEKVDDFEFVFLDFDKTSYFLKAQTLLGCNVKLPVLYIQLSVLFFLNIIQKYYFKNEYIPKFLTLLFNQIEKNPEFEFQDKQIPDELFKDYLKIVLNKFNSTNDLSILENLWKLITFLIEKVPHFKEIFCNFCRSSFRNNSSRFILKYFEFILLFEKEDFENETVKLLEILSKIRFNDYKQQFNIALINIVKKLENLEILSNYLTTIFSLNDIYKNKEVEEMARIILLKLNDDQINEIILLISCQFDTRFKTIFSFEYLPIFNALSLICDVKPNFYQKVISSIPYKINIWSNWDISERSKAILLSQDP